MSSQPTVSEIFRRALEIRREKPEASYDEIKAQIVKEFSSGEFPPVSKLSIPEYDNIAPEEDWTAGLPVILRGIQMKDWNEIAHGIIIILDQLENYPKQSGREDDPRKEWRNRQKGIEEVTEKNLSKWMPEELMELARKSVIKSRQSK
ncbi:MAG: hypothetical protein N2Z23_03925 [Pyrinomonadaceae bacterium]|nr:hypothetical protein [Pyrinomonadaceae bacterium]MCX7639576.1 hypothetical protein [Pyrinomonadaceae bacterium]MDW8303969.1 hypothetical protein [Acidobacteriota bacterium]